MMIPSSPHCWKVVKLILTTLMGNASINVQATQPQRKKGKQKAQRNVSFIVEEDTILVSTWLNISMDPIRGTDQSSTQMWSRIYEYYSTYKKPNCQEQSIVSLTNRWSIIQKCVNKFCDNLAQVEGIRPSGATEQDKNLKHNFTMDHCWNLLRHQLKWQAHVNLIKKKNGSSSGIIPNSIPLGEDIENVPVDYERPPGKKVEKRKLELEIKIEEDRSDLVTLKKRKINIEVTSKEIDSLNDVQQEYFHNLQMEIIEEQRNRAISHI
ncbi:hypothetical protein CIPAW_07G184900 [Carya illinoinensis]|uniref:No apical meristem-associated C-terminal domain-containing protein n=1 Tax=Carya illinoinensis TaxID=32201 RepID=A0A8T1PWV9_CARIL|nr:hypothetical protein CIPAW_07G184900 [Carya illinoinensis]KAG6649030.1 hypothetical protein CIPAW_07G184900 [Carya illinoinensis]